MSEPLKPCPWCGAEPEMKSWHGGGPRKREISCVSDDCPAAPMVTGSTARKAIERWNRRESGSAAEEAAFFEAARAFCAADDARYVTWSEPDAKQRNRAATNLTIKLRPKLLHAYRSMVEAAQKEERTP